MNHRHINLSFMRHGTRPLCSPQRKIILIQRGGAGNNNNNNIRKQFSLRVGLDTTPPLGLMLYGGRRFARDQGKHAKIMRLI